MYLIALSTFGMTKKEFLKLSPREFFDALELYHNQKLQDYDIHRRNTAYIITSFTGKQILPADLYKLYPDEKDSSYISEEDIKQNGKEAFEQMDRKYKKAIELSLSN